MYSNRPGSRSTAAARNASATASPGSRGCPSERSATASSPCSARSRVPSLNMRRIQPPDSSWDLVQRETVTAAWSRDAGGAGHAAGVPAEGIVLVEDPASDRGAMQGTEGVDHHRQLVGL